jgi:mRNA-degrading endonuclease toxin of MazEF toxin-antitoxin module
MNRGDVVLVRFPHPSGLRGKKRPAVVVQTGA